MHFASHRSIVPGFVVAAIFLCGSDLGAQEPPKPPVAATPSLHYWDGDLLDLVAAIPVQDDGRIKPLLTFADFKLLQYSGERSLAWTVKEGSQVHSFERTSVEFLLDTIFFPNEATNYPCFRIDHPALLDEIGVARPATGSSDLASYDQISAGRQALDRKATQLMNDPIKREGRNRSVTEEEILQLSRKVREFESLLDLLDFARHDFPVGADADARAIFGGAAQVSLATLLEKMPQIRAELRILGDGRAHIADERRKAERAALETLMKSAVEASRFSTALCMIPPPGMPGGNLSREDPWLTVPDVLEKTMDVKEPEASLAPQVAAVTALVEAWNGREDRGAMRAALTKLHDLVVAAATTRGEYTKVKSEVAFYRAGLFSCAIGFYVVGCLGVAIGWLLRRDHAWQRWMLRFMVIPLAMNLAGIAWHSYLSGHPPATTIYETILFMSVIAVLAALLIERLNRRRVAIALAALIGAYGTWCAGRFAAKEAFDSGTDTMPTLQAVLDANLWLAAHAATLTIGLGAGLLAGLFANVYVIGRLVGRRRCNGRLHRPIARMTYGAVCMALLFTVVGTVVGGVWANNTWGSFWGWDPKENGALMVCAFELAMLYARMDGRLNDLALCLGAIFCTTLIAFSWWHVSVLGVGLHAYGFTHGILEKLWLFYGVEWLVVAAGLWLWFADRRRRGGEAGPSPEIEKVPVSRWRERLRRWCAGAAAS